MPVSDCEVRDPRVRRTRQQLQSALGTLMQSTSFDEISVQDITELAAVNRATFYDHYTDKYALLEAMVASGFHQLLHERKVEYRVSNPATAAALILAVCDYLTRVHGKASCDRQHAFEPLMDAAIINVLHRILQPSKVRSGSPAALRQQMAAMAVSWAIYGAVKKWFTMPRRVSAEKVTPQILSLVRPLLDGATASALTA